MIEIAISTCAREPSYVNQMLSSMFETSNLSSLPAPRVVVDGDDPSFLGPWAEDPRVAIETEETPAGTPVLHRICRSTSRCMTQGDGPLLSFQDDIVFAPGWLDRLKHTVKEIEKTGHRDVFHTGFVLSLWYSGLVWGRSHSRYNPKCFHGNLGLYISPKARNRLSNHMRENGYEKYTEADDVLVRNFCASGGAALFMSNPSLVQHMGKSSTGSSDRFVQSPTFGRRW